MGSLSALSVNVTGVRIATSTIAARAQVPVTSGGKNPKFVRIVASVLTYVRFGGSTVTAVNTDLAVQPGDALIVRVLGQSDVSDSHCYVSALAETGTGVVQVQPLEDF
jgi:hypothetical protein